MAISSRYNPGSEKGLTYRQYRKGVKRLGGKEVASRAQYKRIQKKLRKKRGGGFTTARTSAIEKQLRKAGLTEKEIAKLRGK